MGVRNLADGAVPGAVRDRDRLRAARGKEFLREIAEQRGVPSFLIDGPEDIRAEWLSGREKIGVTAGASAPEVLVQQVVARIKELGGKASVEMPGRQEHIVFSLPPALRKAVK